MVDERDLGLQMIVLLILLAQPLQGAGDVLLLHFVARLQLEHFVVYG